MSQKVNDDDKSEIKSDSKQEKVGRDAINKTSSSQDQSKTNIYNPTYNTINLITSDNKEILDKITQIIIKTQPHLHASVEDDKKIDKQTEKWEQTDGIFSLIENLEDTAQILEALKFDERRKKLNKKLEPIIEVIGGSDKANMINAIEIVCREDEIDATTDEEDLSELQEDLGVRRTFLFQVTPSTMRAKFKKIYNLLRCGEIETVFLAKLEEIKGANTELEDVKFKFLTFWNNMLTNHPNKVFCSNESEFDRELTEGYIKEQVCERIDADKKRVYLYSRGKSMNLLARKIAKDIESEYDTIQIKVDKYTIAKIFSRKFTFINESS